MTCLFSNTFSVSPHPFIVIRYIFSHSLLHASAGPFDLRALFSPCSATSPCRCFAHLVLHFPLRTVTIGQKLSLISGYTQPIVKPYLYIWLFRIRAVIHAILFIGHCNQINTHLLGSLSSSKALQVLGFLPLVRLRYPARN